jgi:outer membrane immunogenic protein
MKIKLVVAATATVMASTAMAQSAFEGFYAQAGIGYETVSPSISTSLSVGGAGVPTGISTSNSNSFAGTVTAGYNFAINKDFLLGIGAEYSPIAGNSQNVNLSVPGLSANNPVGTYKKKNSYNFFVSPGMVVGNDGLAYAKIGYTGATQSENSVDGSSTTNYTGYSLGLGYKQIIKGGLYGFGEVNYASYGNKTYTQSGSIAGTPVSASITSSANVMNVLVGVGYKF